MADSCIPIDAAPTKDHLMHSIPNSRGVINIYVVRERNDSGLE